MKSRNFRRIRLAKEILVRSKIRFSRPGKVDVVIFHRQGSADFLDHVGNANWMIVDPLPQTEDVYVRPKLIWAMFLKIRDGSPLETAYLSALIQYIDPAIVITRVHNSKPFQSVDRATSGIRFLAVQNGTLSLLHDFPLSEWRIFHSELLVFGDFETDQYAVAGAEVQTFHSAGSLSVSEFQEKYREMAWDSKFDLCVISDFGTDEDLDQLFAYIRRYAHDSGLRVCVAGRVVSGESLSAAEEEWFFSRLGLDIKYFPKIEGKYVAYSLSHQSTVTIAWCSSVAREMFGLGRRVLACNFTDSDAYDFPVPGPWFLREATYAEFANALNTMLGMTDLKYREICGEMPKYLMANSEIVSTREVLRGIISDAIYEKDTIK